MTEIGAVRWDESMRIFGGPGHLLARNCCFWQTSRSMTLKQYATDTVAVLSVLKSAMLLNGGAAIAMLAFTAYLSESRPFSIPVLAPTILPFAFGTLLSGLIYGGLSFAQHYYARGQTDWGNRLTLLCIALGVAAYVAFFIGILFVYAILRTKL